MGRTVGWAGRVTAVAAALLVGGCSLGEPIERTVLPGEITFVANGTSKYGVALTYPGGDADELEDLSGSLDCEITTADGKTEVDTGNVNATVLTVGDTTRWHTFTPPEGPTRVRCYVARGGGRAERMLGSGEAELMIVRLDD